MPFHTALALNVSDQQQLHQQEQQKAREQQLAPVTPDVRLEPDLPAHSGALLFPKETPCFPIQQVVLERTDESAKWIQLNALAKKGENQCLGNVGINMLMSALQNRLIDRGYITSRVLAPEQDLTTGILHLLVIPGKLRHIERTEDSDRYLTYFNTLPLREGAMLNLRDIEQGLENLQRIPTVQAALDIAPGDEPGESDVMLTFKQKRMWRLGASFDDSGTVETGRHQAGLTFYLDNPLSLGDLFYISAGHDIKGKTRKGTRNQTIHYSIPFGYWMFSATGSQNHYHQTVAGSNLDYQYSGISKNLTLRASRILHRNASQKTTLFYEVSRRHSKNFINDTEVEIQRRDTSAWKLGLQHRHYIDNITFDGGLEYQRGTRWFGAQPAAEEAMGDATALSSIVRFSAGLNVPFQFLNQQWIYSTQYQQQFGQRSLTSQDRFSIGGRWSVRGFDGELSLSADNGWTIRNDLAWLLPWQGHQIYVGVDYGEVSGNNSDFLLGKHLAGGVIGLKGYIPALLLNYDLFAGTPFSKPEGFKTSKIAVGFSLFWEY